MLQNKNYNLWNKIFIYGIVSLKTAEENISGHEDNSIKITKTNIKRRNFSK